MKVSETGCGTGLTWPRWVVGPDWDVKVFGFLNSFSMGGWGMGNGELGNDVYQVVQTVAQHGHLSCFGLFVCTCADVFPKSFAGIFPLFLVPFCHGNLVTN